jgi:hypothetical protein
MNNKDKIILDLCGGTASWSKPYKDAGYTVHVITLPVYDVMVFWTDGEYLYFPKSNGEPDLVVKKSDVYGILAAPPCTMFSILQRSHTTPRNLRQGMDAVKQCLAIIWEVQYRNKRLAFWALENPKAYLRWFLGKPPLTFQPYEYGDPHSKATDIWGYFNEPKKRPVEPIKGRGHSKSSAKELPPVPEDYRLPGVDKRTIARSITPQGFAQAFYEANK